MKRCGLGEWVPGDDVGVWMTVVGGDLQETESTEVRKNLTMY
jgi:hypothetical protein